MCLLLVTLLSGCGGRAGTEQIPELANGQTIDQISAPARNLSIEQAVAQVRETAAPDGIDAALFERMKEQLIRDIRASNPDKVTATPPQGVHNQVSDLKLLGNPTVGFRLQWTYVNTGDCNLDGLVSINDLTPIGQFFSRSRNEGDWVKASRADGNNDGLISINDITPIGQNYLNFCAGYHIYGSGAENGPWEQLGMQPLDGAPEFGPYLMGFNLPDTPDMYFQIRPFDDLGVEGIPSQVSKPTVDPGKVQLGMDDFLHMQTIGPLGGTLGGELGTGGPLIQFEFPPDAVEEPGEFRIGINDGSYQPILGALKSPIVAVDTGGRRSFKKPVRIQVEFDRKDLGKAIVPYIVNDNGELELIDLVEVDNFTAEFETWQLHEHLVWVVQDLVIGDFFAQFRTIGFDPALDGLQVVNTGSMWHPGGECFGMTGFSNWYYNTQVWSEGDLFPRFMYEVPIYGGKSGQRIICTRAFTSIAKEWNTYWDTFVGPQGGLTDAQRFYSICNGIENAGHPVLVDLRHENGTGGAHSVLAYAHSASELFVYDPNAPGIERTITFNSGSGSFTPYSGYDSIRYSGSGSLWLDEPYMNILEDAEHEFAENGYASITITSHGSGQDVLHGTTLITGRVESTVELVDEIQISVGTSYHEVSVPADGNFSLNVNILTGNNPFYFSTWATRLNGSVVFVPHDMPSGSFHLNGV
jgi:hypothetical protein